MGETHTDLNYMLQVGVLYGVEMISPSYIGQWSGPSGRTAIQLVKAEELISYYIYLSCEIWPQ